MPTACQTLSQVVSVVMMVLQIGLSFPILEAKTKTELARAGFESSLFSCPGRDLGQTRKPKT